MTGCDWTVSPVRVFQGLLPAWELRACMQKQSTVRMWAFAYLVGFDVRIVSRKQQKAGPEMYSI